MGQEVALLASCTLYEDIDRLCGVAMELVVRKELTLWRATVDEVVVMNLSSGTLYFWVRSDDDVPTPLYPRELLLALPEHGSEVPKAGKPWARVASISASRATNSNDLYGAVGLFVESLSNRIADSAYCTMVS